MTPGIIDRLLSLGALGLASLAILAGIFFFINRKPVEPYLIFIKSRILWLVFAISAVATSGSLYYSEIVGYPPCKLCWLQRIFMYPLVLISGLAIFKKQREILDYILALSVVGFAISLYHNYIYFGGKQFSSCDASGLGESCLRRFVTEFGFVTIPLMSGLAFFSLIIFVLVAKKWKK